MKKTLLLIVWAIPFFISAQQLVVGRVLDTKNEPLTGVNVMVMHENTGTITNTDGKFTIKATEKDSLEFSLLGYQRKNIKALLSQEMLITLEEDTKKLDEVVVIGYGEQKRKDLTGSLSKVNIGNISKIPVPNIDMALAGRIAGVRITANDAQPGSELNIIVRGASSLTQSNSPLYVIDGFPMEDFNSAALNPSEVLSINVLKDASATAIYGSRGANGVVIIETKKGTIGKPVITYEGSYGIQKVSKTMDMMNPYEFVKYQIERDSTISTSTYLTTPNLTLDDYKNKDFIDWQDLLFRDAPITKHSLSLTGGTNTNKYVISGSYVDQKGVVTNSGLKKYQGRIKLDQKVNDKLNVGLNMNFSNDINYGQITSEKASSTNAYTTYLMYRTWGYRPVNIGLDDIYNDLFDGDDELTAIMNPIVSSNNELRQQNRNIFTLNTTIEYNILNNLKLLIRGGINNRQITDEEFNNSKTFRGYPSSLNTNGVNGSFGTNSKFNWVNENMLTYRKLINKNNNLDITAAFSMEGTKSSNYGYDVINIPVEELGLSGMDQGTPSNTVSDKSENRLISGLTRINYSLKSRYLFTASIRADGSSKFNPENRWGYFPSGAFAWRMDEEPFIKKFKLISESKLRISYGITGNNRVGDNDKDQVLDITDYYSFNNGTPQYALGFKNLGNSSLKWEKTAQLDIGYDLSLFKNRINITLDLYDKTTSDLLLKANIPYSSGLGTSYKNVGKIQNRGLEFSFNTQNIKTKEFCWESDFNISFNRSKVLELSEGQSSILSSMSWTNDWNAANLYITKIGGPASAFYGYVWDGIYQYNDFDVSSNGSYTLKSSVSANGSDRKTIQPGDIKYKDQNGDGTVNSYDLVVTGNPLPKHTGGLGNTLSYKNFVVNAFFQWSYGNDVFNANRMIFEGNPTNKNINQFSSYVNRWTPENQSNENFRVGGYGPRGVYSSRTIEDGSFIRFKTLQLSYNLSKTLIRSIGVQQIEIYTAMNNLYTWTKYSGMDPEVSVNNSTLTPGFDYSAYPQNKTYLIGIKIVL